MPTYDYRCRDCGHTIEVVHSFHDEGPAVCERCQGPMVRVLHPAGVIFRGSGFYATDSRASSKVSTPKTDGGGGSGSTTTPGSDSKTPGSDSKTSGSDSTSSGGAGGAE